jgi:hypothetical protein
MDRDIWKQVTGAIRRAARATKPSVRDPEYSDYLIAAMYLWSVWHDRPLSWAGDRGHYGPLFRPRKLPSVSQFTRRVKTPSIEAILQRVHDELAEVHLCSEVSFLDGKALEVSPVSKDKQATRGKVPGGFGKGYKLHGLVTEDQRIPNWSVMPLNVAEQSVAMELVCDQMLRAAGLSPLTLADSNYDSADLHKQAGAGGGLLLTPLKGQGRVKGGKHHPVTLRQMGPARRAAVAAWKDHADLCRFVLELRQEIERVFSALTCCGGGLGPLPAWVRTLERVRRWVGAKIILYHARLRVRKEREKKEAKTVAA